MAGLKAAGMVEDAPESIAKFLRNNNAALDKAQLGQYLGHGNAEEVGPPFFTTWICRHCLA